MMAGGIATLAVTRVTGGQTRETGGELRWTFDTGDDVGHGYQ